MNSKWIEVRQVAEKSVTGALQKIHSFLPQLCFAQFKIDRRAKERIASLGLSGIRHANASPYVFLA
jgi:hypothetical protein